MAEVNLPNSQNDVITTMSHVLLSFQNLIRTEMPEVAVVYTEDLSYDSALKQLIGNSDYYGDNAPDTLPLFAYNRTVLREVEDRALGRRAKNGSGCMRVGDEVLRYDVAYGEFDIQFLYAANNIELTEKFEVVYNSNAGITGSKSLEVDMDALGVFKYFLKYEDLNEIQLEKEDQFYKGVIGSILIRGFYFTFRGKSGLIKEINQRIISSHDIPNKVVEEILGTTQIT